MRIREYGFLSSRHVDRKLAQARASLAAAEAPPVPAVGEGWQALLRRVTGVDVTVCPRCEGPLRRISFRNERELDAIRRALALAEARAPC